MGQRQREGAFAGNVLKSAQILLPTTVAAAAAAAADSAAVSATAEFWLALVLLEFSN